MRCRYYLRPGLLKTTVAFREPLKVPLIYYHEKASEGKQANNDKSGDRYRAIPYTFTWGIKAH